MEMEATAPRGPLDIKKLEHFEEANGLRLPDGYRDFLIRYNGGRPVNDTVQLAHGETILHSFYGMHEEGDATNIFYNLDVYAGRVPDMYLPIGDDPGGNLFLLSLRGENFGEISFWRHEWELEEGDAGEYFENVEVLSPSFSAFVQQFK